MNESSATKQEMVTAYQAPVNAEILKFNSVHVSKLPTKKKEV